MPFQTMSNLAIQVESLSEDIGDFIDENPINKEIQTVEDLDVCIDKITNLRSIFRNKYKELRAHESYQSTHDGTFESKMTAVKNYIADMNDARHKIRVKRFMSNQEDKEYQEKQTKFLVNDILRMINELEADMIIPLKDVSQEEILVRN